MLCLITNRKLFREPLESRVETILRCGGVSTVILREKDLGSESLLPLAHSMRLLCTRYGAELVVNTDLAVAAESGADGVQLPYKVFLCERDNPALKNLTVGVSVHSLEEALDACERGAGRLLFGHIFPTGCKPGLEARGLAQLAAIAAAVQIPVWAVGGILPPMASAVRDAGAAKICIMSTLLEAEDPEQTLQEYKTNMKL